GGYRSTNIDRMPISAQDGLFGVATGTREGIGQVGTFDPYAEVSAVTLGNASGIETKPYGETAEKYGSGTMLLSGIRDGSWTCIYGADFGDRGASVVSFKVRGYRSGAIRISLGSPDGEVCGYAAFDAPGREFQEIAAQLDKHPAGKQDLYFTFAGSGYELLSWRFTA
ncbi:MAG: carbohydrate-binding protein, partial [Lachnospiraceae bacterium]|nr:carbohydrate-binding protein [Lachnospiraceae bacterium]